MLSPGDIVLIEFPHTNQAGSKVRPGLVLGVSSKHKQGDVNVAYITSELDAYLYDPLCYIHHSGGYGTRHPQA